MDEIKFSSLEDLYNRLKPALRSKVKELRQLDKIYIKDKTERFHFDPPLMSGFEYLSNTRWESSTNLTLDQMVDDILYLDNDKIDEYVQNKIIKENYNNSKERE